MQRFPRQNVFTWCMRVICWCVLAFAAPHAAADICVYVDKDGNKLYSNVAPEKGWKKLSCAAGDDTPRSADRTAKSSPTPSQEESPSPTPEVPGHAGQLNPCTHSP